MHTLGFERCSPEENSIPLILVPTCSVKGGARLDVGFIHYLEALHRRMPLQRSAPNGAIKLLTDSTVNATYSTYALNSALKSAS